MRKMNLTGILLVLLALCGVGNGMAEYPAVEISGIPAFRQRLSYIIPEEINPLSITVTVDVGGKYADCGIDCVSMIEGYFKGYGNEDDRVYHAVIAARNSNVDWANITYDPTANITVQPFPLSGYYNTSSMSAENVYTLLSTGNPVMVHRANSSGESEHWVVIYGYDGSSSNLEWKGFKIMSPTYAQDGVWYQHLSDLVTSWSFINGFMYRTSGLSNLIDAHSLNLERSKLSSNYPWIAFTITDKVNVREMPGTGNKRITQIHDAGTHVTVTGEALAPNGEKWWSIQLSNGVEGYIRGDLLSIQYSAVQGNSAEMEKAKVSWDLEVGKRVTSYTSYLGLEQNIPIEYEITEISKTTINNGTYQLKIRLESWCDFEPTSEDVSSVAFNTWDGYAGGGFAWCAVDYTTGLNLIYDNAFQVYITDTRIDGKINHFTGGISWMDVPAWAAREITITYPQDYEGLCIGVLGRANINQYRDSLSLLDNEHYEYVQTEGDNAFWSGQSSINSCSEINLGSNPHFMRVTKEPVAAFPENNPGGGGRGGTW